MRPILVTGATGQVGHELLRELAPLGPVVAPRRQSLDLADPEGAASFVRRLRPRAVVNAGAYTAVDRAESDRALCMTVNGVTPGALAVAARECGAVFVHYSTDYVFDGTRETPYVETDVPAPLNVYGESKLAGENAVVAAGGDHLILRTSWVYGPRGANFMRTMLRLAHEREELRVVNDQRGAPTWSRSIAATTVHLLHAVLGAPAPDRFGTFHLTSAGSATWYEFARAVVEGDPRRGGQRCRRVIPISSAEHPTPARRPANGMLDGTKLRTRFGLALPDWREQLGLVLADLPAVG